MAARGGAGSLRCGGTVAWGAFLLGLLALSAGVHGVAARAEDGLMASYRRMLVSDTAEAPALAPVNGSSPGVSKYNYYNCQNFGTDCNNGFATWAIVVIAVLGSLFIIGALILSCYRRRAYAAYASRFNRPYGGTPYGQGGPYPAGGAPQAYPGAPPQGATYGYPAAGANPSGPGYPQNPGAYNNPYPPNVAAPPMAK